MSVENVWVVSAVTTHETKHTNENLPHIMQKHHIKIQRKDGNQEQYTGDIIAKSGADVTKNFCDFLRANTQEKFLVTETRAYLHPRPGDAHPIN